VTPPRYILSCDPGLSGAFCLYEIATRKIQIWDMLTIDGKVSPEGVAMIVDLAKSMSRGSIVAVVENVSSMPRQAGAFNFGRSAGVVHGVLGAMGVPMELISPNVWKSAVGLRKLVGESQDQNKTRARELAAKLWPANVTEFKRVKDDGRAEAALLSRHYANSKGWL
jgi:crossover junction endodeoxyribonuclease RuvC